MPNCPKLIVVHPVANRILNHYQVDRLDLYERDHFLRRYDFYKRAASRLASTLLDDWDTSIQRLYAAQHTYFVLVIIPPTRAYLMLSKAVLRVTMIKTTVLISGFSVTQPISKSHVRTAWFR